MVSMGGNLRRDIFGVSPQRCKTRCPAGRVLWHGCCDSRRAGLFRYMPENGRRKWHLKPT